MNISFPPENTHKKAFTKNIILGTAGHIDHGKTAFIKALTGIDCDRLKEEKQRGITIELGYAHMRLPSGVKVGIVDVPGHELFVSKMVAGASGADVIALIIAADEGIKPQTQEHLHICNILGIQKGIIVLNKKDLVDDELLFLQREEIETFVAGTFLEGAPIVPVSSLSGEGIGEFIDTLETIAADIAEKPVQKPFRLPVDAVITIAGFGTVVRGTALSGHIAAGEEVAILPGGRKSRIRGLQNHGQVIEIGYAGERLAVNLTDIKRDEIDRGAVVARSGSFCQSNAFLVDLHYLSSNRKPLREKSQCQFHALTARINAEVRLLDEEMLPQGEKGYAVVNAVEPIVVSHGDHCVMMACENSTTIGGGRILNPLYPFSEGQTPTKEYIRVLREGSLQDKISLFIQESSENGITLLSLCGILNEAEITVGKHISDLRRSAIIYENEGNRLFHKKQVLTLKENMTRIINEYHRVYPLRHGIGREELFNRAKANTGLLHLVFSIMIQENRIEIIDGLVKAKKFNIGKTDAGLILQRVERKYFKYGLTPETPQEAAGRLNLDKRQLAEALHSLARSGRLIKISDDYYLHPDHFDQVILSVKVFFEKNSVLTPPDVRDMLGITRKYIMPLLEYLDAIKVTVRIQEGRRLRK